MWGKEWSVVGFLVGHCLVLASYWLRFICGVLFLYKFHIFPHLCCIRENITFVSCWIVVKKEGSGRTRA